MKVDIPPENVDVLPDVETKDLGFPFVVTEEDRDRISADSTAD